MVTWAGSLCTMPLGTFEWTYSVAAHARRKETNGVVVNCRRVCSATAQQRAYDVMHERAVPFEMASARYKSSVFTPVFTAQCCLMIRHRAGRPKSVDAVAAPTKRREETQRHAGAPRSMLAVAFLAMAWAVACYGNGLTGDFVFDDTVAIVANPDVSVRGARVHRVAKWWRAPTITSQANASTQWWAMLQHDYWGTPISSNSSHKSYRPLTVATFRLNFLLGARCRTLRALRASMTAARCRRPEHVWVPCGQCLAAQHCHRLGLLTRLRGMAQPLMPAATGVSFFARRVRPQRPDRSLGCALVRGPSCAHRGRDRCGAFCPRLNVQPYVLTLCQALWGARSCWRACLAWPE